MYTEAELAAAWLRRRAVMPELARGPRDAATSEDRFASAAEHSRNVSRELVFPNKSKQIFNKL